MATRRTPDSAVKGIPSHARRHAATIGAVSFHSTSPLLLWIVAILRRIFALYVAAERSRRRWTPAIATQPWRPGRQRDSRPASADRLPRIGRNNEEIVMGFNKVSTLLAAAMAISTQGAAPHGDRIAIAPAN
jgi:hypothetical protein